MNKEVIDYLQKNKDIYTKDALVAQLKASGFSDGDIEDGVKMMYENDLQSSDVPTLTKISKSKSKWSFSKLGAFFGLLYLGISLVAMALVSQDYGIISSTLSFVNILNSLVSLIIFPVTMVLNFVIPTEYSMIVDQILAALISATLVYVAGNFFSNKDVDQKETTPNSIKIVAISIILYIIVAIVVYNLEISASNKKPYNPDEWTHFGLSIITCIWAVVTFLLYLLMSIRNSKSK